VQGAAATKWAPLSVVIFSRPTMRRVHHQSDYRAGVPPIYFGRLLLPLVIPGRRLLAAASCPACLLGSLAAPTSFFSLILSFSSLPHLVGACRSVRHSPWAATPPHLLRAVANALSSHALLAAAWGLNLPYLGLGRLPCPFAVVAYAHALMVTCCLLNLLSHRSSAPTLIALRRSAAWAESSVRLPT